MTNRQLRESGVKPGWLFQVADKLTSECHPDAQGYMAHRCGQILTVRDVVEDYSDIWLKAVEDYAAGEAMYQEGWNWFPRAIVAVFPPGYDSNENIEVASDDELTSLLFG